MGFNSAFKGLILWFHSADGKARVLSFAAECMWEKKLNVVKERIYRRVM